MIGAILLASASITASIFIVQVAVLPFIFKYSKSFRSKIVFPNCINYPRNLDYENPQSSNITGGRNFYIEFISKVDKRYIKLGTWHIAPASLAYDVFSDKNEIQDRMYQALKSTRDTVVLYCHGNSNHRAASPYRLKMYKIFQELNFHVITFDYRGYGDSTRVRPTESGVVEDTFHVYSWLIESLNKDNRPTVIIWGHSLGTAVASNLVANLYSLCSQYNKNPLPIPDALILEAAFNNLCEAIERHPLSNLVSWLPYYKHMFIKPFQDSSEYAFQTDQYLGGVPHVPILMLHSKGDRVVPYELALKLHDTVSRSRLTQRSAPITLHSFDRGHGIGHNNLCLASGLKDVVGNFLKTLQK